MHLVIYYYWKYNSKILTENNQSRVEHVTYDHPKTNNYQNTVNNFASMARLKNILYNTHRWRYNYFTSLSQPTNNSHWISKMKDSNMHRIIWTIIFIISGILFLTETILLINTVLVGPLDSNLLVSSFYVLTIGLFIASLVKLFFSDHRQW